MKICLLLVMGFLALWAVSAFAGDFEQVTVADTPIGLTAARIAGAYSATCRLETAEIRFRVDGGGNPSTTYGTLLYVGEVWESKTGEEISKFRAIRTGGTSGVLSCTYR